MSETASSTSESKKPKKGRKTKPPSVEPIGAEAAYKVVATGLVHLRLENEPVKVAVKDGALLLRLDNVPIQIMADLMAVLGQQKAVLPPPPSTIATSGKEQEPTNV